jgi:Zn-dependent protease
MAKDSKRFTWMLVAFKFSKILAVLKSIQMFKVLLSVASMLLSVIVYGLTLGFWFGVGFVAMLFIHEMGHVIALRRKHLPSSLPVFIPFVGAAIFAPDMGDRATEAYVGYGGPLLGSIAAIACFGLWAVTGATSDLLLVISYVGVYINLFNLIPISPLDGGHITQVVGGWFKYIGAALAVGLVVYSGQPGMIFLLILMLDSFEFPLFGRAAAASTLLCVMFGLMITGYSPEIVVDLIDGTVASLITAMYVYRDWRRVSREWEYLAMSRRIGGYVDEYATDFPSSADDFRTRLRFAQMREAVYRPAEPQRAFPSARTRGRWFVAYIALAVVLSGTIAVQNAYLPTQMKPPTNR